MSDEQKTYLIFIANMQLVCPFQRGRRDREHMLPVKAYVELPERGLRAMWHLTVSPSPSTSGSRDVRVTANLTQRVQLLGANHYTVNILLPPASCQRSLTCTRNTKLTVQSPSDSLRRLKPQWSNYNSTGNETQTHRCCFLALHN